MKPYHYLVCINFVSMTVRRYYRDLYGRVRASHAAELGNIHAGSVYELEDFRSNPPDELRVGKK